MTSKRLPEKFDIFLAGVGGLGVLTMARIVAEAGLKQGFEIKTCEFHGLAQRYGAIHSHIRFGKNIKSAMIPEGQSDLVIALEPLEALRSAYYASKQAKTVFIINTEKLYPTTCFVEGHKYTPVDAIIQQLKAFSSKVYPVDASGIVKKETGRTITENIYMLGLANGLGLLPVEEKNIIGAVDFVLRGRHIKENEKVFRMGEKAGKKLL